MGKLPAGERPITHTGGLYRLWSQCRKGFISDWEAGHSKFWDSAVRGNSSLRAAMLRLVKAEISEALGVSFAELLWDAE
eukprot:8481770-Pyramimonas_sp.AAC.1